MKRFLFLLLTFSLVVCVAGCGGSGEKAEETAQKAAGDLETAAEEAAAEVQEAVEEIAGEEMIVEVGCGHCIYHMDGLEACAPAAVVGQDTLLLTGVEIDAHAIGLCTAPKKATVTGQVKEGELVISRIDFVK